MTKQTCEYCELPGAEYTDEVYEDKSRWLCKMHANYLDGIDRWLDKWYINYSKTYSRKER